jgi:thiamine kinase-like enzyme
MFETLVVYDNSPVIGSEIKNIVGDKSFGNIIFQKKSLKEHMADALAGSSFVKDVFMWEDFGELPAFIEKLSSYSSQTPVLHIYADSVIANREDFEVLLSKVRFAKESLAVKNGKLTAVVFRDVQEYIRFLEQCLISKNTKEMPEFMQFETLETGAFACVCDPDVFLRFITKGFDTRYFNLVAGDDYIVTKSSANKQKIKSEYTYYHLLPESMKMWFVMPFDYREDKDGASYSMERFHVTDLAIKWVNNSISIREFEKILTMLFYFIKTRSKKSITPEEYARAADDLYIEKLDTRIGQIKKSGIYPVIHDYILRGTQYEGIDEIVEEYKALYAAIRKKNKFEKVSVIGHGDLCFSNMLYHGETSSMKFIDVKGALTEEELWTDPYYDLAKLSHSICGLYDFFNSNLYEVRLDAELKFHLEIDFDNSEYAEVFKRFLTDNGYDYAAVRLYEASLFLSMIPLHVDHPKKVFGFLLNAIEILKGVRQCLKK